MFRFGVFFCFVFSLMLNTAYSQETHEDVCTSSTTHGSAHKVIIMDAGSSGVRTMAYCFEKAEGDQVFDLKFQTPLIESNSKLEPDSKLTPKFASFLELHRPPSFYPNPARHFFLGATAGLRSLNNGDAKKILLNGVRELSKVDYVAQYNNNVRLLSGLEEGAYTWFGVNFIMQATGVESSNLTYRMKRMVSWQQSQFGIIELGGGSVQIAFRVPRYLKHDGLKRDTSPDLSRTEEANVKTFKLLDQYELEVYANSLPRKGLNFAYRDLESKYSSNPAANPCLVKDTLILDENGAKIYAYGSYDACVEAINNSLFHPLQASFNGDNVSDKDDIIDRVYRNFLPKRFFLTGYFFDQTAAMGLPELLTPAYLEEAARYVCNQDYGTLLFADLVNSIYVGFRGTPPVRRAEALLFLKEKISQGGVPRKTGVREYCTHMTYISQLLKKIGLSPDHHIYTEKSLFYRNNGYGVSWPLGYAILATNGWE